MTTPTAEDDKELVVEVSALVYEKKVKGSDVAFTLGRAAGSISRLLEHLKFCKQVMWTEWPDRCELMDSDTSKSTFPPGTTFEDAVGMMIRRTRDEPINDE
jgi:trehalose-6-phosphate synthase